MKKAIIITFGVLVVVSLALAIMPRIRDEIHWQWASYKNETTSYEAYMKAWPKGRYAAEARERYDKHGWAEAQAANSIEGFEQYVQLHAEGKHVAEAKNSIESLDWQDASTSHTIRSYRKYTTTYPRGRFVQQAETKAAALRTDEAPYEAALRAGTEASLKQFLADFSGHEKEPEAQQAIKDITEGRDIVDLISEKKVEIKTQGSGIESVSIRIRKRVPYPITVHIPTGSFFVSARQSAQNMVSTTESKVRLIEDDWRSVSVDAACANRPRDIPGGDDTFAVQRSPHQRDLARLMPVLDFAEVSFAVRQAAVWLVSDDADYSDMGILVSRGLGGFGSRVIDEADAARAMQIAAESGVDLTRKAIWRDRQRILKGLKAGELKTWLEQKK